MKFPIGIENNNEGRSVAWSLEHPGCFSYGSNREEAMAGILQAINEYMEWITLNNNGRCWIEAINIEPYIAETWDVYTIDEEYQLSGQGYQVNAWFLYDWKPLKAPDIKHAKKLMTWSRSDLLGVLSDLNAEKLELSFPEERWSIAGILKHIGGAEWWYLDRLGLSFPSQNLAEDPFDRLESVRSRFMEVLDNFIDLQQVVGIDGEFWSPRKLLRRALWHERDHTAHIQKLKGRI